MSPARGKKQQFVAARPRSEVFTAVGVSVGIILATLLLIWLIRPGAPGVPGKGGLFTRQPRMTALILLSLLAAAGVILYVRHRRTQPKRLGARGMIALGLVLVLIIATLGGIFWPGGVVRHWPSAPKFDETPATVPASVPSTKPGTTVPGTTAKTGTTVSTPSTQASPTTKGR